jgi:hypothetical protein
MLRHFCILCVAAFTMWSAVVGLVFVACSGGGGSGGGGGRETEGTVKLFLGKLNVPLFDSISVDVSASDMASIHISKKTLEDNLKIEGIPKGEARKFEVKIYADSGKLVQEGEANVEIKPDENITIPITLKALFGFLRLEIPLGFTNNTGVSSGKLFLDNLEFDMKIEYGKGVFITGALPLDNKLSLSIELYDKNGDILFMGWEEITLKLISQAETMQLKSNQGTANIEFITDSEGPKEIMVEIPTKSRPPKDYGEVFFTEIYANTPANEDNFQYMELFNSTSDILQLSNNCKLVRTDNGTEHKITNLTILPMSYAIIGRSSVLDKDYSSSFALLKTTMSLGLFCGDSAIDILTYSSKGDNPFPIKTGTAMHLPLKNYETRTLGSSWCLGFSPKEDAICP